jgi:hypothetical protein
MYHLPLRLNGAWAGLSTARTVERQGSAGGQPSARIGIRRWVGFGIFTTYGFREFPIVTITASDFAFLGGAPKRCSYYLNADVKNVPIAERSVNLCGLLPLRLSRPDQIEHQRLFFTRRTRGLTLFHILRLNWRRNLPGNFRNDANCRLHVGAVFFRAFQFRAQPIDTLVERGQFLRERANRVLHGLASRGPLPHCQRCNGCSGTDGAYRCGIKHRLCLF